MELKEEGARRGHRRRPRRRWTTAPLTSQPCCSVVDLEAKSTSTAPHREEQSRARWRRIGGAWRSAMAGRRRRSGAGCGGGGERSRAAAEGPARRRRDWRSGFGARRSRRGARRAGAGGEQMRRQEWRGGAERREQCRGAEQQRREQCEAEGRGGGSGAGEEGPRPARKEESVRPWPTRKEVASVWRRREGRRD